jgi:hypothetical protein
MNKGMIAKALLIVLSMSLAWGASAEDKFHKLKGAQIRAKFSGMEADRSGASVRFLRPQRNCGELFDGAQKAGKVVGRQGPAV